LIESSVSGPVNFVAPNPVTNAEFTKTLGRVLSKPTLFPVPAFGARLAFGEMADALLLSSQRVKPGVLQDFAYPTLDSALRHLLATDKRG
jgi:NAD dependent epimerase/dehydratase family enzyme